MKNFASLVTGDGNITLIVDTKTFSVGKSHPNYVLIVEAIKAKRYDDLESLIDIPATIAATMRNSPVTVKHGQVFYGDLPIHNTVTERILDFIREGLPTDPLIRFLENLMANPMPMAVAELYDFLENTSNGRSQFPITEDGCFIGYKGVRDDWFDQHSGTVNNAIGNVIEMSREKVDPDRRNECSHGYHVGTLEYARDFAARTVLVKVNPADCIAVPKDHNCSKLRVCRYEVLAEAEGQIESPMYPMPEPAPAHEEEDVVEVTTTVKRTVKRSPCSHCGAKGGKKHEASCRRPDRSSPYRGY